MKGFEDTPTIQPKEVPNQAEQRYDQASDHRVGGRKEHIKSIELAKRWKGRPDHVVKACAKMSMQKYCKHTN